MRHYNVSCTKYLKCATDYSVAEVAIANRKWTTAKIKKIILTWSDRNFYHSI